MVKPRCDFIQLRNVQLPEPIYLKNDAWNLPNKPQPANLSVRVSYPSSILSLAAKHDAIGDTLSYGDLYRGIISTIRTNNEKVLKPEESNGPPATNIVDIAELISKAALDELSAALQSARDGREDLLREDSWYAQGRDEVMVDLHLPKAILRAEGGLRCLLVARSTRGQEKRSIDYDVTVRIEGIRCACVIGVNPHERLDKQVVELALEFPERVNVDGEGPDRRSVVDGYKEMVSMVAEIVDATSYETVEALATRAAQVVVTRFGLEEVTVRAEKPSALTFAAYSGLEITRTSKDFSY